MDMHEIVKNVVIRKSTSIKPDAEATESKTINIEIKFDGVTVEDVFNKAVSQAVIQWQNGPGRKHFTTWKNGQTVKIEFKAPGRAPQIDPKTAMLNEAEAAGVDVKDKVAMSEWLSKKFGI